ncbi:hypothetical protein OEZ86_003110 [Tetradesmus obliquus]|nr:hypothetical protein OEZ86_003110 [Tetradesmus obliquus]
MGTLGAPCSSSSERFHASQKGCEAGGSAVPSGSSYLTAAAGTTAGQGMRGRHLAAGAAAAQQPEQPEQQEYEEFEEDEEFEEGEYEEGEFEQDAAAQLPGTDSALTYTGPESAAAIEAAALAAIGSEGQPAAAAVLEEYEEEPEPFEQPEERPMFLSDLFGMAAEVEAAQMLAEEFGDVFATGISEVADDVLPGDVYCCVERIHGLYTTDGHEPEELEAALANGAIAVVAVAGNKLGVDIPDSVPVIWAEDADELSARLAAVYYDSPSAAMNTVAVAGTNGKTTVSWLIRGVLEQAGELTGMIGSIEHALAEHQLQPDGKLWKSQVDDPAAGRECSSPFSLVPYRGRYSVEETTPNGLQMQQLLAGMRDRGATAAVVECTAAGIAGGSADWLQPNIVVYTDTGDNPAELQLFESKQEYVDSTLELLRCLKDPQQQRAVINADDEHFAAAAAAAGAVPRITYGINNPAADVRAESISLTLWQTTIIVATPIGRLEIITNLVGRHNVYNVLAAVAVGVLLNLPLAEIGAGIEAVQVIPGRCEVVNNVLDLPLEGEEGEELQQQQQQPNLPRDFPVVVDAADTPQRLAAVLDALREAGAERIFTVFGCDGVTTTGEMRARMGEVAHQRSDFVILTNSSPRLEDPADIIQDIVAGWPNEMFEQYAAYVYNVFQDQTRAPLWFEPFLHSAQRRWKRHVMEDRFQAIRAAIGTAAPGDVVLLAGRGHRDHVEHFDGEDGITRGWFDDRVEARNALSKLEYLYALVNLDRSELPWGKPDDAKTVVVEFD